MSKQVREIFKKMGIEKGSISQDAKISEEIINAIRANASKDSVVEAFLFKLIDIELENTGKQWWRYKEPYMSLLKEYSSKWVDNHEN